MCSGPYLWQAWVALEQVHWVQIGPNMRLTAEFWEAKIIFHNTGFAIISLGQEIYIYTRCLRSNGKKRKDENYTLV
jgi:hypothetical protein